MKLQLRVLGSMETRMAEKDGIALFRVGYNPVGWQLFRDCCNTMQCSRHNA